MFKRAYFIRSTNFDENSDKLGDSWAMVERSMFLSPVHIVNEYRHEKENSLGGICMVTEFRRIK